MYACICIESGGSSSQRVRGRSVEVRGRWRFAGKVLGVLSPRGPLSHTNHVKSFGFNRKKKLLTDLRLLLFFFQVVRTLCAHPTHVLSYTCAWKKDDEREKLTKRVKGQQNVRKKVD